MGIGYAWEKLLAAVTSMASSPKSLQYRIADAYTGSLIRIRPEEDLPIEYHHIYAEISASMQREEAKHGEGVAYASARTMTEQEAENIASKIVNLYDNIAAEYRQSKEA